jgi:hypothetical protein
MHPLFAKVSRRAGLLGRRLALVAVFAVAALSTASVVVAPAAQAEYFTGRLGPGQWTTDGTVFAIDDQNAGNGLSYSICVGPIQKSGSGYIAPYGWKCAPEIVSWSYTPIWAAGGVYNNSGASYGFNDENW